MAREGTRKNQGERQCSGGCGLEMQTGRGREASEAGQCPVITGSECLSETSPPQLFGVFAVAKQFQQ